MNEYRKLKQSDYSHHLLMETRWRDMDALGHLNHTAYLTYFESARTEYYASLGFGTLRFEQNPGLILGGMSVDYINQVTHPARLIICHRINRVGKKSFDLLGAIFEDNHNDPICTGLFHMIAYNYKHKISVYVPQEIVANLYIK